MENPNLHNPHLEGDSFFWKSGPVGILLGHGFTATSAEVRPLAKKLHDKGYTVAGPLLPGHGTRPQDLNQVRWQDWVRTGESSLEQLFQACEVVFIGGESMGGVLALYLASRNPKISGVLLYAPAMRLVLSPLDKVKLYLGALFLNEVGRSSLDCSESWQGYPGLPLKGAIQLLRFQSATLARLSNIRQPVMILQGRRDTTVAPEAGKIILDGISSTVKELHWMENSSHTILLDVELDQSTDLSVSFMEKCLAPDPSRSK